MIIKGNGEERTKEQEAEGAKDDVPAEKAEKSELTPVILAFVPGSGVGPPLYDRPPDL